MMNQTKEDSKVMLWFKANFTVKSIAINAIIAALYAVITMLCGPLSYEFSQFRISEFMNLLVFFNPTYTIGLTLGCLIANLASLYGVYDIVSGTLATLISCLLIVGCSKVVKNLFLAGLIPCLVNAIIVPFTIYLANLGTVDQINLAAMYWIMFGWVFLGEFVCIIGIGYPLFFILKRKGVRLLEMLNLNRNLDFKW